MKRIVESAGRAVGTVVGTAAGVAAGAAQALVGKVPERKPVDPMAEELYWREHHASEPYFDGFNFAFEDYLPAWRTGWEGRAKYPGRTFDDAMRDLQQDFNWNRGKSRLLWEQARAAVRASFERST
ncbi:MAG TPA: hypothetical protein VF280_08425 [Burkholderiales bacterium]